MGTLFRTTEHGHPHQRHWHLARHEQTRLKNLELLINACGPFSRKDDDSNEHNDNHEYMIDSGCCGHVCPQRFAPPFRVTSTSNIMAVAANHVRQTATGADEHITFVRKPLLSKSTLKHLGITMIFGYDIFRSISVTAIRNGSRTINMRTCRGRFADEVRHQKTMVTSGRSVPNKVDEEVYVWPGDEANGCVNGERRAVAHADQAGSLDDTSGDASS